MRGAGGTTAHVPGRPWPPAPLFPLLESSRPDRLLESPQVSAVSSSVRPSLTSQSPLTPSPVSTPNHPILFFRVVLTEGIVFIPSVKYPIPALGLSV